MKHAIIFYIFAMHLCTSIADDLKINEILTKSINKSDARLNFSFSNVIIDNGKFAITLESDSHKIGIETYTARTEDGELIINFFNEEIIDFYFIDTTNKNHTSLIKSGISEKLFQDLKKKFSEKYKLPKNLNITIPTSSTYYGKNSTVTRKITRWNDKENNYNIDLIVSSAKIINKPLCIAESGGLSGETLVRHRIFCRENGETTYHLRYQNISNSNLAYENISNYTTSQTKKEEELKRKQKEILLNKF